MMLTHWSNRSHKLSKTNWWCHSIQIFYLNLIFSWLWSLFFFIMIAEQWINIKYVAPKMSLRSAKNETEKNSLIKNHVLFSKNVANFLSTSFCAFLINVSIFNNSLKTWFLILIYLIKRHNFFYLRHSYQLFFKISKFSLCVWVFVCNYSHEKKSFNFFFVN